MNNFSIWWNFCMLPNNDGAANDTADDGAGTTRWGWTYPTWCDAMAHVGRAPSLVEFNAMDKAGAGVLAESYFWNRQSGPQLPAGCDMSLVDWAWNSGAEGVEVIQEHLGKLYRGRIDGAAGPMTVQAITSYGQKAFINDVYTWRTDFLDECGFRNRFPGLYRRTKECRNIAIELMNREVKDADFLKLVGQTVKRT